MKCSSCGFHNDDNAKYCKKCGKQLPVMLEQHCAHCGNQLINQAKYCKYCGSIVEVKNGEHSRQNKSDKKANRKSKKTSVIWGIFAMVIVVLTASSVLRHPKQQNSDNDLEEQELLETYDSDNTYNDIYDENPTENNDEEKIALEDNNMDFQETEDKRVFYSQNISVEENVLIIREKYNELVSSISSGRYVESRIEDNVTGYYDGNELKAVKVSRGTNGIDYAQSYYYDNGDLIFAYYENHDSHRFYFYKEYLMRWRYCEEADKPSNAINYDWENFDGYLDWEFTVLNNSNAFK